MRRQGTATAKGFFLALRLFLQLVGWLVRWSLLAGLLQSERTRDEAREPSSSRILHRRTRLVRRLVSLSLLVVAIAALVAVAAKAYVNVGGLGAGTVIAGNFSNPVTHLALEGTEHETAGAPFAITVSAEDRYGNTVAGFTGTIHFASSDPAASLPPDYAFSTGAGNDNGSHTFAGGVTLASADTDEAVTATDSVAPSVSGTADFDVAQARPGLSLAAPGADVVNSAISASSITATLSSSSGANAAGTLSFVVFGPALSPPSAPCAGGNALGAPVAVSGSGSYSPSEDFTPAQAGDYWVDAVYSGDLDNATTTSECPPQSAQEIVVSKATPSITTRPSAAVSVGGVVSDQGTLIDAANPTGALTFTLYSDPSCATTPVFSSTNAIASESAASSGFTPTTPGTYYWQASYPGDANNDAVTSACGPAAETVTVTAVSPGIITTT